MCPHLVTAPFMVPSTAKPTFTAPGCGGTEEFSPFPVLWGAVHGMASLAFPVSDFYDINYSAGTAQLICIIKRCGGDWFYNNSSDLWSTFHPRGS